MRHAAEDCSSLAVAGFGKISPNRATTSKNHSSQKNYCVLYAATSRRG
jgi:hypothetical protein